MPKTRDQYVKGAQEHDTYMESFPGVIVKIDDGSLDCPKCGKAIPPKELFCLDCFRQEPKPKRRYCAPRPDDSGNMFEGV